MKARSVTRDGEADGWIPPVGYRAQTAQDGSTRLVVYAADLAGTHLRLVDALGSPVSVRYLQLTDRATGQLPKPRTFVAMDLPGDRVRAALVARPALVWGDARHQLWLRGRFGEQVVLDELGVLYCYPDDPAFRDAVSDLPVTGETGMDGRDYVRVELLAEADEQERTLLAELGLREWG